VITAVDTGVLLDVLAADARYGVRSADALRRCLAEGGLIACAPVWAEVAAAYARPPLAASVLDEIGVGFDVIGRDAALAAGAAWRAYRAGGGTRRRVMTDFLIGAHARERADRLLARDRGFYRSYFGRLSVLDPSA
jgi:predicted nucleic acid-binding protein